MTSSVYRPTRRDFIRGSGITIGGVYLLSVAGCGGAEPAADNGMQPYSGDVAVAHLDTILSAAPFHIALERGFYDELALELEHVSFSGGTETIRGIVTAGMRFGMPATVSALIAQQDTAPGLRIIGGLFNAPQVVFIAPAGSRFDSADDLEGTSIGISTPGSITDYFSHRIVQKERLKPGKEVEIVNVGGPSDVWTAAQQGVVDIAYATPPLSDQLVSKGEAKVVLDTADYVPAWVDNVLVTTEEFINERPEVLKRWVLAIERSLDVIRDEPKEAAAIYGPVVDVDVDTVARAFRDTREAWSVGLDMRGIKATVEAGYKLGPLNHEPDLEKIIVDDFVPKDE